ncbi:hypothetical protein BDF14DRAFT_1997568 [Spinellus fusiger]|nr:hypothetical protein BDF14DRAFT_1997568 [Spinellus fusiger]
MHGCGFDNDENGCPHLDKTLTKPTLLATEEALLDLSISRIINMLNTSMQDTYREFFSQHQWARIHNIESASNLDCYDGLSLESSALFDSIVHAGDTIYVALVDGENSCETTKNMAHLNKSIFIPMQTASVYGKKIDLMLRYDGNMKIELSSNEWKRSRVQEDLKLKQQSKKLRTNAAILNHLNSHCSTDISELLAMDFIGNVGYLYMLKLTEDGVYVASLLSKLIVPKDLSNLDMFKQTLDYLLKMKASEDS